MLISNINVLNNEVEKVVSVRYTVYNHFTKIKIANAYDFSDILFQPTLYSYDLSTQLQCVGFTVGGILLKFPYFKKKSEAYLYVKCKKFMDDSMGSKQKHRTTV